MIEVVYQGRKMEISDDDFRLPKNVRQIGDAQEESRVIYIEDFVMSYVKHFNCNDYRYGVLLGNIKRKDDKTYVFIQGAVRAKPALDNEIIFDEEVWSDIYENVKTYFEKVEVIGWFLSTPGILSGDMERIKKIHLDHFAGNDKVCFLIDRIECEDTLFAYEDGDMKKCGGHYIYYEKNEDMQSYMIMNEEKGMENEQGINAQVHKIIYKEPEKKSKPKKKKVTRKIPTFRYSTSTVMAAAILFGAVAIMNASGQIRDLKGEVHKMANKNYASNFYDTNQNPEIVDVASQVTTIWDSGVATKETTTAVPESTEAQTTVEQEQQTSQPSEQPSSEVQESQTVQEEPTADVETTHKVYKVQQGDSLYSISKKVYGDIDRIDDIKDANGMDVDNDNLAEGQTLILP